MPGQTITRPQWRKLFAKAIQETGAPFFPGSVNLYTPCTFCGVPIWRMSRGKQLPNDPEVDLYDGQTDTEKTCQSCEEMHRRHPEVVEWVSRVMWWRDMLNNGW
jgi:hypothetical protein